MTTPPPPPPPAGPGPSASPGPDPAPRQRASGTNFDIAHAAQMLLWLDEERRRDRTDLGHVQSAIDAVSALLREVTARTEDLESLAQAQRLALSRLPVFDEQLRAATEPIGALLDWREQQERAARRLEQLRAIELERESKTLGEMLDAIETTRRDVTELRTRHQMLGDDARRLAATIPGVQTVAEATAGSMDALKTRLHLLEEWRRRDTQDVADQLRQVEQLTAEQTRLEQWQQLAEMRWTRQLAEWSTQMEEFRRSVGEVVRTTHTLAGRLDPLRDAIEQVRRSVTEERARREKLDGRLTELVQVVESDVDKRRDLDTRLTAQRGQLAKLGEHDGTIDRALVVIDDRLGRLDEEIARVAGRGEATATWAGRLEGSAHESDARIDAVALRLNEIERAASARDEAVVIQLNEQVRRLDARLTELESREETQKRRQIAELEKQIAEMRSAPAAETPTNVE